MPSESTLRTVVCIGDAPWDAPIWTNRQYVMSLIPEIDGSARVLYVDPPRFVGTTIRSREPSPPAGVSVLRTWLPLPNRVTRRILGRRLDALNMLRVAGSKELGVEGQRVLWTYSPLTLPVLPLILRRIRPDVLVYDVVDDYSAMIHYQSIMGEEGLRAADSQLTRLADRVFVSSIPLLSQRRALNASCIYVGNACDVGAFGAVRAGVPDHPALVEIPEPRIGFHGALTRDKLDVDLIAALALQRPEWSFVFAGPELEPTLRERTGQFSNVYIVPRIPREEAPRFVGGLNVGFLPYVRSGYTASMNPLKMYEFLSAGLPVVSRRLPFVGSDEVKPQAGVIPAETVSEFIAGITDALLGVVGPPELATLAEFDWKEKAKRQWEEVCSIEGHRS